MAEKENTHSSPIWVNSASIASGRKIINTARGLVVSEDRTLDIAFM
jgi:hypothetical protein